MKYWTVSDSWSKLAAASGCDVIWVLVLAPWIAMLALHLTSTTTKSDYFVSFVINQPFWGLLYMVLLGTLLWIGTLRANDCASERCRTDRSLAVLRRGDCSLGLGEKSPRRTIRSSRITSNPFRAYRCGVECLDQVTEEAPRAVTARRNAPRVAAGKLPG
jgi:hypothetical protein